MLQRILKQIPKHARLSSTLPSSSLPLAAVSPSPVWVDSPIFKNSKGQEFSNIPAFRIFDNQGQKVSNEFDKELEAMDTDFLVRMYKTMLFMPALDLVLNSAQRQGRISFYMTSLGEEGVVIGSAAAFDKTDECFSQYRESGVLVWRGYPLADMMAQVFSTASDGATKGRQMPVHYGSKSHHFHTISSPLATQVPQAAGAAYALMRTPGRKDSAVICYMGEGATSEGDFHAGVNIASVKGGPLVLLIRNNGFAISTPVKEQFHGDGLASRGPGYGVPALRIDGNDPLAVYFGCKAARERAVKTQSPVIVEAMSYRVGHHSTSDDSSAYRSASAVEAIKRMDSPITRLRIYLESRGLWNDELEENTKAEQKKEILQAFAKAEKEKKPAIEHMWHDTFAEMERPQKEQREELKRIITKWQKFYREDGERYEGGIDQFIK